MLLMCRRVGQETHSTRIKVALARANEGNGTLWTVITGWEALYAIYSDVPVAVLG